LQSLSERHRAREAATVVSGTPIADTDGRVDHDRSWLETMHERGGIDVGLERGTGLAQRVRGAIELALAVVAPADHGAHRTVSVHQHGGALTRAILAAILPQRVFDRLFGVFLQVDVKREAHDE